MNKEQKEAINVVTSEMYEIAAAHGFHATDGKKISVERMAIFCANLHGEVSELWEATRKGTLGEPSDKNCGLTNGEEELADIAIRVMDTAFSICVDLGLAIELKAKYNSGRPFMHGKKA